MPDTSSDNPSNTPLDTSSQGSPVADASFASYEDAVSELERLVQAMETGRMPLDELLDNYRRGASLLEFCKGRLEVVEQQVKVLEDGQLKNWGDS